MLHSIKRILSRGRSGLRSRVSRAVERRQRERTRSLVEAPEDGESDNDTSSGADPRLTAYLAGGSDAQFEQVRRDAIDTLSETDCVAIWLQAIGDGTPLARARGDRIEQATPHNALYLAGYDDDLTHPEIVQIAIQLFAHHVCVFTSTSHPPNPAEDFDAFQQHGREAIRNTMGLSTAAAQQMFPDTLSEDAPGLFEPQSLAEQRDRALAILEEEDLSMFWLQVMTTSHMISIAPSEDPEPDVAVTEDSPVEYFQARPASGEVKLIQQLAMETAGQHHYIAAQTADQSLEAVSEQGIEMALESGYIIEALT